MTAIWRGLSHSNRLGRKLEASRHVATCKWTRQCTFHKYTTHAKHQQSTRVFDKEQCTDSVGNWLHWLRQGHWPVERSDLAVHRFRALHTLHWRDWVTIFAFEASVQAAFSVCTDSFTGGKTTSVVTIETSTRACAPEACSSGGVGDHEWCLGYKRRRVMWRDQADFCSVTSPSELPAALA